MSLTNLLIVLMVLSTSLGQEESGEYLVQVKFVIKEEKLPEIINHVLNNSLEFDITTEDIINLSKLDQIDLNATNEVINYYNATLGDTFTVDNLQTVLNGLNVELPDFYREFTSQLVLNNAQIGQALNDLSIDAFSFVSAISLNNNEESYKLLREGIYDQDHVSAALTAIDKTENQVYAAARDLIVKRAELLTSGQFMDVLKSHGWRQQSTISLYKALKITTRDVYDVEKFRNLFTNITDNVNQHITLGVFIGETKLAIHESSYNRTIQIVDDIMIRAEANGTEVLFKKVQSLGDSIVELATKQPGPDHIQIVEHYNSNSSEDCSYVTINNGQINVNKVELEDDGFTLVNNGTLQFLLGSALVCNERLYGLAKEQEDNRMSFDLFYTDENPRPEPEPEDHFNTAHHLTPMILSLALNSFICYILM